MRKSLICPKCNGNEILFFPAIADRDDRDIVRPLVIHVQHFSWKDDTEAGKIQAYICKACGFTELYTADIDKIPVDKVPGAKLLVGKR